MRALVGLYIVLGLALAADADGLPGPALSGNAGPPTAEALGRADEALRRGDVPRARQLLDAISIEGESDDTASRLWALRGRVALSEHRWDAARAAFRRLLRDFPQTVQRVELDFLIGESYFREGEYEVAAAHFARLVSGSGAGTTTDSPRGADKRAASWPAWSLLRQAQCFAHLRRWSEARRLAESIATRFPDFLAQYEADYLVGRCWLAEGQYATARAAFERSLQAAVPQHSETAALAQWGIAETFLRQDDYEAARRELLRLEATATTAKWRAAALLQAGTCCERMKQTRDAAELYGRVLKLYPDTAFAQHASARWAALPHRVAAAAADSRN